MGKKQSLFLVILLMIMSILGYPNDNNESLEQDSTIVQIYGETFALKGEEVKQFLYYPIETEKVYKYVPYFLDLKLMTIDNYIY